MPRLIEEDKVQDGTSVQPLDLRRILKNQDPMTFKSKDLMEQTGDVFNDLYVVSKKIEFIRPRVDKTANEIEFEKGRGECTFRPDIAKSQRSIHFGKRLNSMSTAKPKDSVIKIPTEQSVQNA